MAGNPKERVTHQLFDLLRADMSMTQPGIVKIQPYDPLYRNDIIRLIVDIQHNEFGIAITAEDQPDLAAIHEYYQRDRGNFWVALFKARVIGTISLLDIGNDQAALRKMFVAYEFRGEKFNVARKLLGTLLTWSSEAGLQEIFLGTTSHFKAAHRFYEKSGFKELTKEELPTNFPIMKVDTRFYKYNVL